jgi:glutathione synthase/RimK-type ligase-like ATP-grasp enzyme
MGAGVDLENTTALETQISEDLALALGVPSTGFDIAFTTIDGVVVAEVLVIMSSLPKEEVTALANTACEGPWA